MLCIVGTGGFGREVLCCFIDSLKGHTENLSEKVCFMVDDEYYSDSTLKGISIIKLSEIQLAKHDLIIAIGDPKKREDFIKKLPQETKFATVIHPNAIISQWVEIGIGSVICAGCIITSDVKIGKHCHLNLNTTIGHDCIIGDYFTTAPSANISGSCTFADRVYIGTNSGIKQKINITSDVTIGMGAVVIKNIFEPGIYVGNPAKRLEKL